MRHALTELKVDVSQQAQKRKLINGAEKFTIGQKKLINGVVAATQNPMDPKSSVVDAQRRQQSLPQRPNITTTAVFIATARP